MEKIGFYLFNYLNTIFVRKDRYYLNNIFSNCVNLYLWICEKKKKKDADISQ